MNTNMLGPVTARAAVMLLVGLLSAVCAISGSGATREEERAKGEEMLQKAQQDLVQARQLHEGATRALQTAHKEQAMAEQRTQEARVLMHDAFLLIRDPNRIRAAELRAMAETKELQARNEEVELERLHAVAAHHKKVAEDSASAVARIQDAAKNESNPAQKAQLTKMAESLSKEGATASAEAAPVEKNFATLDADRKRLYMEARTLRAEAQTLDPIKK